MVKGEEVPSTPIQIIFVHLIGLPSTPTDELQQRFLFRLVLPPTILFDSSRLKQAKWCSMASTADKKDTFSSQIKPRPIGRNFAGHQLPTFLDVRCLVRLHTPLHVVAKSLKPVRLFSQQLPTFLLFCAPRGVGQRCWIRLHSSFNIVGVTHAHYAWLQSAWVFSVPRCIQLPTLLRVFAFVCI